MITNISLSLQNVSFNELSESPFSGPVWSEGVPRRSDDLLPRNTTWYPHIRDGSWKKMVRYWVVLHVVGETTHFYERCTRDRMNRVIEIIRVFDASVTMSLEYFEKLLGYIIIGLLFTKMTDFRKNPLVFRVFFVGTHSQHQLASQVSSRSPPSNVFGECSMTSTEVVLSSIKKCWLHKGRE